MHALDFFYYRVDKTTNGGRSQQLDDLTTVSLILPEEAGAQHTSHLNEVAPKLTRQAALGMSLLRT